MTSSLKSSKPRAVAAQLQLNVGSASIPNSGSDDQALHPGAAGLVQTLKPASIRRKLCSGMTPSLIHHLSDAPPRHAIGLSEYDV